MRKRGKVIYSHAQHVGKEAVPRWKVFPKKREEAGIKRKVVRGEERQGHKEVIVTAPLVCMSYCHSHLYSMYTTLSNSTWLVHPLAPKGNSMSVDHSSCT